MIRGGDLTDVAVHTGRRCGHIPIRFPASDRFVPGDLVSADPQAASDYQISSELGGFVIVRGGCLHEWSDRLAPDLVCYGWGGIVPGGPATMNMITQALHGPNTSWCNQILRVITRDERIALEHGADTDIDVGHQLVEQATARHAQMRGRSWCCPVCDRLIARVPAVERTH